MSLGSHQQTVGRSQSHITPKGIIDLLGGAASFDLDPAASTPQPWPCARKSYTEADDGLSKKWFGRIWLNPPFDRYRVAEWIERLAEHGRGSCLLHARTEAQWFTPCWRSASGILFFANRIHFYKPDGSRHPYNSGAPPLLVAFGAEDLQRLRESGIAGTLVTSWETVGGVEAHTETALPWEKWKEYPGMVTADLPGGGGYYTWRDTDSVVHAAYRPPWRSPYPAGRPPGPPRLIHPVNKPTRIGSAKTVAEVQALCERHAARDHGRVA
jgi:hypothetical protein